MLLIHELGKDKSSKENSCESDTEYLCQEACSFC